MNKLKLSFLTLFALMLMVMVLPAQASSEGLMGQNGYDLTFEVENDRLCYWMTIPGEMPEKGLNISFFSSSNNYASGDKLIIRSAQEENGRYRGFISSWHYSSGTYDIVRIADGYGADDIVAEWTLDKPITINRNAFSVKDGVQLNFDRQIGNMLHFQFVGLDPEHAHSIVTETRLRGTFRASGSTTASYSKNSADQWNQYDSVDLFAENITTNSISYQIDVSDSIRFKLTDTGFTEKLPIVTFTVEGGDIYFDITTESIVSADSTITAADIPSVICGIPVRSIGSYAFDCAYKLTQVTLPDSLTTIQECAFDCCWALSDVYYNGTKEQWSAITIAEQNDILFNAMIHCTPTISWNFSSAPLPITGNAAETLLVRVNEGKSIPVTLTAETASTAETMLAAIYDENQRFLGLDMVDVVFSDGVFTTPVSFTNYGSAASMKLLLLDGSYAPVVQNLTVEP